MTAASDIFKALSEPVRLRILALLTRGELCVCDVMDVLGLPQSTTSRHLGRLRQAGLVQDRRGGKWVYYCLREDGSAVSEGVRRVLQGVMEEETVRADLLRLEQHLKTKHC